MPKRQSAIKATAVYTESGFWVDQVPGDTSDDAEFQSRLFKDLKSAPYETLYRHAFLDKPGYDISLVFLLEIAMRVIFDITHNPDTDITRIAPHPSDENIDRLLQAVPYVLGYEFADRDWIINLYNGIAQVFNHEFSSFSGTVQEYFKSKNSELSVAGKVFFHLVEHKDPAYPFAFLATYSAGHKNSVKHLPLKNALQKYKKQDQLISLLAAVSRAAEKSDLVSELVETGELFAPIKFTPKEAYIFLKETPIYEECGVICRIPNFWKKKAGARMKVSLGGNTPATVGLEAIISFSPAIYLGDEEFTPQEIKDLLTETNGLALLKGKWVELDQEKLQKLLAAFEEIEGQQITLAEALRIESGLSQINDHLTGMEIEVTNGQWLQKFREMTQNIHQPESMETSANFKANLRQYQSYGVSWLNYMVQSHFGALLADDMGLGKTIQILALLDNLGNKNVKTLLIIPASLITNWRKEAEKFAPQLKVKILHGGETDFEPEDADLFITTYGMTLRIDKLTQINWDLLILDEAQAIKNHVNKQTKAVKNISAHEKIALTGTPVENRLSDLWSIFDFLNRGLLGSQKEFSTFAKSLKQNTAGYEKLRRAVSPFILRRLKTDKSIISDLPDKIETKQFTTLTKKQIALYNQLVNEIRKAITEDMPDINRKGLILTSLMKFKQICNHPAQYLGNGDYAPKHSGKFETLGEICQTIREKRERVLVFTQFKELTQPLADFLQTVFDRSGLVLHGGTSVKKRGELVEYFNGPEYVPFMVLSLKAGGVGLNLTGANHVIHFDRWWNPAVENQATDRAFRIGQQKNVLVYKFITSGAIEEKIDTIIQSKQELANSVISASLGENWITEMSNDELFALFRLEA